MGSSPDVKRLARLRVVAVDTFVSLAAAELDDGSSIEGVAERDWAAPVTLALFPALVEDSSCSMLTLDMRTTARLINAPPVFTSVRVLESSAIVMRLVLTIGFSTVASALVVSFFLPFPPLFGLAASAVLSVSSALAFRLVLAAGLDISLVSSPCLFFSAFGVIASSSAVWRLVLGFALGISFDVSPLLDLTFLTLFPLSVWTELSSSSNSASSALFCRVTLFEPLTIFLDVSALLEAVFLAFFPFPRSGVRTSSSLVWRLVLVVGLGISLDESAFSAFLAFLARIFLVGGSSLGLSTTSALTSFLSEELPGVPGRL